MPSAIEIVKPFGQFFQLTAVSLGDSLGGLALSTMRLRKGWGNPAVVREMERVGLGFVVSHPFRDETAERMGQPAVVREMERVGLGFVLSHPFRDETAERMGQPAS